MLPGTITPAPTKVIDGEHYIKIGDQWVSRSELEAQREAASRPEHRSEAVDHLTEQGFVELSRPVRPLLERLAPHNPVIANRGLSGTTQLFRDAEGERYVMLLPDNSTYHLNTSQYQALVA